MEVDSRVHIGDWGLDRFYPDGRIPYNTRDHTNVCGYCGSMSPQDALELLSDPNCHGSGSDWKYGWPHKFYIRVDKRGVKFYSKHLYDADEETYKALTELIAKKLGIRFTIDEKGLAYTSPYHGYQTWFSGAYERDAPIVPEDM